MRRYPGGKGGSGVAQRIINLQPPHEVYVEPFLGSGLVMRIKRPAAWNYGLDLDSRALALSDDIAVPGRVAGGGGAGPQFEFKLGDGISWLEQRRSWRETLVYCDPPYLAETRSCQRRMYRFELEPGRHQALLAVLASIVAAGGMVQVSGYPSEMYRQALRGWTEVRYPTVVSSGEVREEVLWMSYPAPGELHDYRYLGSDYRERERIRRKQRRWAARLAGMDVQERQALLSVLSQLRKR